MFHLQTAGFQRHGLSSWTMTGPSQTVARRLCFQSRAERKGLEFHCFQPGCGIGSWVTFSRCPCAQAVPPAPHMIRGDLAKLEVVDPPTRTAKPVKPGHPSAPHPQEWDTGRFAAGEEEVGRLCCESG